jgi:23S rRNA pseudouridine2605 synthase
MYILNNKDLIIFFKKFLCINNMQLNKYIAHAGVCSRRKAAELVLAGAVTVNGKVEINPSYQVQPTDVVRVNGKKVVAEHKIYIILNKPTNCIATVSDEKGRRTVIDLLKPDITQRVYPIGRLDRETTGILVLTNDGDLAQKLAHPRYEVKKTYYVVLNKALEPQHAQALRLGVRLEDGISKVDSVAPVAPMKKNILHVTLHSGKYRVIRRMFETLGYEVIELDRIVFATLTKKGLPRGMWRFLTKKELQDLQKSE